MRCRVSIDTGNAWRDDPRCKPEVGQGWLKVPKEMARAAQILCITGSVLLLVTAVLHGTGYSAISAAIAASNSPVFLKHVVPGLWAHFSIHLVVLAVFGFILAFRRINSLIALLALAVATDAAWAFSLAGFFEGVALLIAAASSFALAAICGSHLAARSSGRAARFGR